MAKFFRVGRSYINLDHYTHIALPGGSDDDVVQFSRFDGGTSIGMPIPNLSDLETMLRPIIPAADNTWAIVMWSDGDRAGGIDTQLIVGWREWDGYAEPVFNQAISNNDFAFLETPDGKFIHLEYDGGTYPSRVHAVEFVRNEMRRRNAEKKGV